MEIPEQLTVTRDVLFCVAVSDCKLELIGTHQLCALCWLYFVLVPYVQTQDLY